MCKQRLITNYVNACKHEYNVYIRHCKYIVGAFTGKIFFPQTSGHLIVLCNGLGQLMKLNHYH